MFKRPFISQIFYVILFINPKSFKNPVYSIYVCPFRLVREE